MAEKISTQFGSSLAALLADKIVTVHKEFNGKKFYQAVHKTYEEKTLTQRVELIADELRNHLPADYKTALEILVQILGPANEFETGMFKHFYWVGPIAKFVEKYGVDHYEISVNAIAEITKRSTGEFAIRPFIRKYPKQTLAQMKKWAKSKDFHLRRLASEGLRPKLPWASKLELFIEEPTPVFAILEILKEDKIKFVQKSVGNHITDYLKVNPDAARKLITEWKNNGNAHTQWIIKRATRKIS